MNWVEDLGFAARMVRKQPWFSAAILLTLALGIGVNTTVFTLVNAVLYKPLAFPRGDRFVLLSHVVPSRNIESGRISWPDFLELEKSNQTLEDLGAFAPEGHARRLPLPTTWDS